MYQLFLGQTIGLGLIILTSPLLKEKVVKLQLGLNFVCFIIGFYLNVVGLAAFYAQEGPIHCYEISVTGAPVEQRHAQNFIITFVVFAWIFFSLLSLLCCCGSLAVVAAIASKR